MPSLKTEIFVAMFGVSGASNATPVGMITYFDEGRAGSGAVKGSSFFYVQEYQGPPIDPVNLNYEAEKKRVFFLPEEFKESGIFRVFHDSMPGTWGRRLLNNNPHRAPLTTWLIVLVPGIQPLSAAL